MGVRGEVRAEQPSRGENGVKQTKYCLCNLSREADEISGLGRRIPGIGRQPRE